MGMPYAFIKSLFSTNSDGHGFDHAVRVAFFARKLARACGADEQIVVIAALLHDADDHKLKLATKDNAKRWLEANCPEIADAVLEAIRTVSYSKGLIPTTIEGFCLQDADRLDALGRAGVRRAFAFGREHGRSDEGTAEFLYGERGLGLKLSLPMSQDIARILKGQMPDEIRCFLEQG